MLSIDQNSHSLWDVVPKLQALSAAGYPVSHYIEDVDVAFTAMGADQDAPLRLARERFYRSGGADWGAALFYFDFLGRQPFEIRHWEPHTGLKTAALAHQLGLSVDDLYDRYSPSDNHQLIGPSYVGDRLHHRTLGDLTVTETAGFIRDLLGHARRNCLERFPSSASQHRTNTWFDIETGRVNKLLNTLSKQRLVTFYDQWMRFYLGPATLLDSSSSLFALGNNPDQTVVLEIFLKDYSLSSRLYNEAVQESDLGLRPLNTDEGELPFFATLKHDGHLVRCLVYLRDNVLSIGQQKFPLTPERGLPMVALRKAGILCLTGKAILLVTQVRVGTQGRPLAMPYHGSMYLPAAHRLTRKLRQAHLLSAPLQPIMRVRFQLLEHLKKLDTPITLPKYLADRLGQGELAARELGNHYQELMQEARQRLEAFRRPEGRLAWQKEAFPAILDTIAGLERHRRDLAERDPKSPAIRQLSREQKQYERQLLENLVEEVDRCFQLSELDFWDSRGALMPWCIALGGEDFYQNLLSNARIYPEEE